MATKLPSGSYRTQVFIGYNDKGRRSYKSFTADTAKRADFLALQWQAEHPSAAVSGDTVENCMNAFIRQKRAVLSPATIRGYTFIQKRLLVNFPKFCAKQLGAISREEMQELINGLYATSSSKTVRNCHSFLCAVCNSRGITAPPCTLPPKKKPEYNIPDETTIQRLYAASKGTPLEVPILLLGSIGPMRRGEIVAASIDDLSEDDSLHVHRTAVYDDHSRQIIKDYPKTLDSDRIILLPHSVAEKIRAQGYICNLQLNSLSRAFSKLLKEKNIPHFRFHDLRHAFVSIAHAAGLPDAYIQERGGWSTNYTMNAVYRHTLDADRKKAQETVNNVFASLL